MDALIQTPWDAISRFYDDENNFSDDTDMFLKMAKHRRGEILELACGTGRMLIPFAQSGHRITGIDFSKSMLEILRGRTERLPANVRKRITLLHGDITDFTLSKQFAFIFIGFNSLLSIVNFRKQICVLQNIWRHLKSGGRMAIAVLNPDLKLFSEKIPYVKHAGSWIDSRTGRYVDCFEFTYFDLANQIIYGTKLYDEIDEKGIVRRTRCAYEMRYYFSFELQMILEQLGFQIVNLYGDYTLQPFTENSPNIIIECKKPK